MKGFNARWTQGVSHEDSKRKQRYREILSSRSGFNLQREILNELKEEIQKQQDREPKYEDSAWPYRQAHLNGQKEMIDKVLNLLPTEEQYDYLNKTLTENT